MTDAERKALVERRVELACSATFIADEYPDVMRPKQTEQLYAMRGLIEADGKRIAELEASLRDIATMKWDSLKQGCDVACRVAKIARAALGDDQ